KLVQIVIGAARGSRKFAAGTGSRMIDSALARLLIQKHASLAKQLVRATSKYSFFAPGLGKACGCYFRSNAKMRCQPSDVARCHLNAIIDGTAICDAFIAIVVFWFFTND